VLAHKTRTDGAKRQTSQDWEHNLNQCVGSSQQSMACHLAAEQKTCLPHFRQATHVISWILVAAHKRDEAKAPC
jgi:transposase